MKATALVERHNDRGFYTIAWLAHEAILKQAPPGDVRTALQEYKRRVTSEVDALIDQCEDA